MIFKIDKGTVLQQTPIPTKMPLILAGTGRSGTSWLLNVFTLKWTYRPIFEPLHPGQVPEAREMVRLYLTDEDQNDTLKLFMERVLFSKSDHAWIRWMHMGITNPTPFVRKSMQYIYNLPKYRFWAKNRVVKLINGNLLLQWLQKNFKVKIVFVIRHPCAVIASQLKMGWPSDLSCFTRQEKLVSDYLKPFLSLINSVESTSEKIALRWCIENYVPFIQYNEHSIDIIPVFYENMVLKPEQTLRDLLTRLEYPHNEIETICYLFSRQKTPRKESLSKWKGSLSADLVNKIFSYAHVFGLNFYDQNGYPQNERFEK